jgi:hypothetical protein
LFLENEFVIRHVFFSVSFQIDSDFMEIEAVFVGALLTIHEELAELGGSKGSSEHSVMQNILVNCLQKYKKESLRGLRLRFLSGAKMSGKPNKKGLL